MARTLKRSLANLPKRNISQLTALVKIRLNRMQTRPRLLDASSTASSLAPGSTSHPSVTPIIKDLQARG